MTRRLALVTLVGLASLTGCPSDQYDYKTWIKKLDDSHENERAVQKLEELGQPGAIPALGDAWADQGKPVRFLQVIIALARPLTPDEAKAQFKPEFEESGRPASWDAALPYLKKALLEVDEANPRSVDSASKAADAMGEAKLQGGLEALIDLAQKPVTKKLVSSQVAAIHAIGQYDNEKAAAAAALVKLIDREPPPHPRTANKENKAAIIEKFEQFLAITGASINALADLRAPQAAKTLVVAQYRTPELFTQIRRALVASGPDAKAELRKVIAGNHPEVEALFKQKKYAMYCGDKGDAPSDQCQEVAAKDFYPVTVLGDFYDPATVPDLLAVLNRKPLPAYYVDEQPGPTQHVAVFDALGKIGSADAARPVYALWKGVKAPKKGELAPPEFNTKILAIVKYPFLARDLTGVDELAAIAADNGSDRESQFHDQLRQVAAEAFARMSRDPKDISILQGLAKKYYEASTEKRKAADGKPKADAAAADKVFEGQKKEVDDLKVNLLKVTKDTSKTAADINAETKKVKDAETKLKEHKKKHREATAPYKQLDEMAKAYKRFARVFEEHIARIQTGIRCKDDLECYAATLKMKPEDAKPYVKAYISDIDTFTKEEMVRLLEGNVERAMLELGKRGQKASKYTDLLLDNAKSDNRIIRQSILLALPKVAAVPCANCEAKLDAALKAGEGKNMLKDLQLETTMMRNYFSWAGGKTPSKTAPPAAEAPAAAAPAEGGEPATKDAEKDDEKEPAKSAPAKSAPAKKKGK
ncbi:MAG TPA: hypothetical protein VN253_18860 [Kofleriaceae bacterium]|nr:hypothetical protein [Kofleriaceae bacterium]